jgi:uncharacterized protein YwqG
MTIQELQNKMTQTGLEEYFSIIKPHVRNTVGIVLQKANESEFKIGESKIGGCPHLPDKYLWATETEVEKRFFLFRNHEEKTVTRPLSFIAQINFSDIKKYDADNILPERGILYFFYSANINGFGYNLSDKDKFKVIYYDGDIKDLKIRDYPSDLQKYARFKACKPVFEHAISLPSPESEFYEIFGDDEKVERLLDLFEMEKYHKLLGYADTIQNEDMELISELVTNNIDCNENVYANQNINIQKWKSKSKEWQLLLQIDSDENSNMIWCDSGRLYFFIKKEDLLNKNFDKCWFCLQSF